jgi:hypothetical protein
MERWLLRYLGVGSVERIHLFLQIHLLNAAEQRLLHASWSRCHRLLVAVHYILERLEPTVPA